MHIIVEITLVVHVRQFNQQVAILHVEIRPVTVVSSFAIALLLSAVVIVEGEVLDFVNLSVHIQVGLHLANAWRVPVPNVDLQILDVSSPEVCLAEEVASMLHQFVDGIYVLRVSSEILVALGLAEAKHFDQASIHESDESYCS